MVSQGPGIIKIQQIYWRGIKGMFRFFAEPELYIRPAFGGAQYQPIADYYSCGLFFVLASAFALLISIW